MTENEILELLKTDCHAISKIARYTGITKQCFYNWIKKDKIPTAKLPYIEAAAARYVRLKTWQ